MKRVFKRDSCVLYPGLRNGYRTRWDRRAQAIEFHKGSTEGSGYDASMKSARRENRPPYEDKIS